MLLDQFCSFCSDYPVESKIPAWKACAVRMQLYANLKSLQVTVAGWRSILCSAAFSFARNLGLCTVHL